MRIIVSFFGTMGVFVLMLSILLTLNTHETAAAEDNTSIDAATEESLMLLIKEDGRINYDLEKATESFMLDFFSKVNQNADFEVTINEGEEEGVLSAVVVAKYKNPDGTDTTTTCIRTIVANQVI